MYSAIFLTSKAIFDRVKTQSAVIQVHEPFNMVVIDSADKLTVTTSEVKNTFTFLDIDNIPGNRAIIRWITEQKASYDQIITYLKANKINVIEDLYNMGMIIVEIPKGTYQSFSNKLTSVIQVYYIEQDTITKVDLCAAIPYTSHWHLDNIQAQCAWNKMVDGGAINANEPPCGPAPLSVDGVTCCTKPEVALLDQGVQRFHPDLHGMLSGCSWNNEGESFEEDRNWNVVNNNNNIDPVDSYENHGTAMAGVIAANNLNNNYGLSPAQNYIRVQVLKVLYSVTTGSSPLVYTGNTAIIQGINRAVQNPRCAAINMSFAMSGANLSVQESIQYARLYARGGKGIPVFAAAGNGPCNGGCAAVVNQIKYPAAADYANAVGASSTGNTKLTWSDFGDDLFVAAPGISIITTDRTGTVGYSTTSTSTNADIYNTNLATYNLFGGTSAACGIVSSVAACMVAVNPNITADQIEAIIGDTAAQTGGYTYDAETGKSPQLGHGVIRMCDAMTEVVNQMGNPTTPVLTLTVPEGAVLDTTTCGTAAITFTLTAEDDFWNDAVGFVYTIHASELSVGNPGMIPLVDGLLSLSESGSYTIVFTIPNNPSIITITDYFILTVNLVDASGQVVNAISSDDGINIEGSRSAAVGNGCPTPGTDLSVQVISYRMVTNNLGQTNRSFRVKYTNTGTVAITSFNRTYGWVGGTTTSNTQTYPGTLPSNGPLLPGQSRTVEISFTGSNTPPQYPATYFHRINTVNGNIDANLSNNYSTIAVTQ